MFNVRSPGLLLKQIRLANHVYLGLPGREMQTASNECMVLLSAEKMHILEQKGRAPGDEVQVELGQLLERAGMIGCRDRVVLMKENLTRYACSLCMLSFRSPTCNLHQVQCELCVVLRCRVLT